ncbi:unnamed protein product [Caenorhabditis brenneri]
MKAIAIYILLICAHGTFPYPSCPPFQRFLECGSACEPSCDRPKIDFCTLQCIINVCQCRDGFVRVSKERCIRPQFCPQHNTTNGLPKKG